jgi:hypothetical protein
MAIHPFLVCSFPRSNFQLTCSCPKDYEISPKIRKAIKIKEGGFFISSEFEILVFMHQ